MPFILSILPGAMRSVLLIYAWMKSLCYTREESGRNGFEIMRIDGSNDCTETEQN